MIKLGVFGLDGIYVSQKDYDRFIQWGKGQFMPETPQELQGNEKICKIHVLCRDGIEKVKETINVIFSDVNTIADVRANANYVTKEDNDHNGAIKALIELTE